MLRRWAIRLGTIAWAVGVAGVAPRAAGAQDPAAVVEPSQEAPEALPPLTPEAATEGPPGAADEPRPAEVAAPTDASDAAANEGGTAPPPGRKPRPGDLGPCALEQTGDAGDRAVDRAHRGLWKTACHAALWFDGLFGEERHPAAAQNVTGRLELSYLYSQYEGSKIRGRWNIRARFPNLSERVEAFAGRDDQDQFVRDRNEGFALRSQFLDLENEDEWVAGFGYGLPGSYAKRTDFRIGANGGRTPKVFVQARHRRNWYIGERDLWHFRETVFWTNRDGYGATTALDFDHLLSRTLLVRWGTIGTVSEATDGLDWRSALVLYQDLSGRRAIAYEGFVRGETHSEVGVTEFGGRVIFRRSILHRDWLWGELIGGYSWPRHYIAEGRKGAAAIGFGIEMLYGRSDTTR